MAGDVVLAVPMRDPGLRVCYSASLHKGNYGTSVRKTPRVTPGSAPWLFSTRCAVDDKLRALFERAASILLYDDGSKREMTQLSLQLLNEVMSTGYPDALVLKALVTHHPDHNEASIRMLQDAEREGSIHPLMYFKLGHYYIQHKDDTKGLMYINQTMMYGYAEAYQLLTQYYTSQGKPRQRTLRYLFDMDVEGHIDHYIYWEIHNICHDRWNDGGERLEYSNEMYTRYDAARNLLRVYDTILPSSEWKGAERKKARQKASEYLWKALEEGKEDDKILERIIKLAMKLGKHSGPNETLERVSGKYSSWHDVALYYSDLLIQRGSPAGNYYKVRANYRWNLDVALKVAKEADQLGLATAGVYFSMGTSIDLHSSNIGKDKVDGRELVRWLEKAVELCDASVDISGSCTRYMCYLVLSRLYGEGRYMLPKDPTKATMYKSLAEECESSHYYDY